MGLEIRAKGMPSARQVAKSPLIKILCSKSPFLGQIAGDPCLKIDNVDTRSPISTEMRCRRWHLEAWIWLMPSGLVHYPRQFQGVELHIIVSLNKGPQYRPQYTIILIIGTPKRVPLILGNPHIVTEE